MTDELISRARAGDAVAFAGLHSTFEAIQALAGDDVAGLGSVTEVSAAESASPQPSIGSCDTQTCNGCCDSNGTCMSGAGDSACGAAGDAGGAIGQLIGEENRGLEYMFIMMNAARFAVGMQGVGISERAYQKAVAYAKDRVQSRPVDGSAKQPVSIIHHPDVRRMLLTMRALTEASRALAYVAAAHCDRPSRSGSCS